MNMFGHISGDQVDEEDLSKLELEQLRETFEIFDKDGDGSITTKELGTVMRSMGQNPSDKELQDMINEFDADGNGIIDFTEFCTMMSRKLKDSDESEDIREAFQVFDKDQRGFIRAEELAAVLKVADGGITDQDILDLLSDADKDSDGTIDYQEFVALMVDK
ncbi:neo-calmodulin-like isoform X2 [Anneissia japonica]|uniref:neo-calmodulin-like isoform X2 n=1 Tax=Anneissia japonica TaxID=1529436 RepID=UPI0014258466|nr:neo-calmodulin-like isoform X2 [Anneissia japonica]